MLSRSLIKLFHVLLIILVTITIVNGILNVTLLSKESIMEIINYALSVTNIDISPVDSIFIARLIRQELWGVHFYSGITAFFMMFIVAYFFQEKKILVSFYRSVKINIFLFSVMFASGLFLFYRAEMELSSVVVSFLRDIHWLGLYSFGVGIVFHIYKVFTSRRVTYKDRF